MRQLTVKLYPYKVSKLVIRVLQEDAVVSISLEVKGDVGSGTRPKGGKGYVGGLDEGYGVPDVSCGEKKSKYKRSSLSALLTNMHETKAYGRHDSGGARQ